MSRRRQLAYLEEAKAEVNRGAASRRRNGAVTMNSGNGPQRILTAGIFSSTSEIIRIAQLDTHSFSATAALLKYNRTQGCLFYFFNFSLCFSMFSIMAVWI
jgi:hypothetical protein